MHDITRRTLLSGVALTALAPALRPAIAAADIAPKRGGILNTILTPEPPILVLGINNQAPTQLAGGKIFQGLLEYSFKLDPMPQLAKSWSVSDDRKTYTFKLQENVTFHDGHKLTADDVIFSIMKFHMELSPRARPIFSKIKEATAPDPHTVVLTLDSPFEPFLLMFDVTACAIVPKHIYEGTDFRTNPQNQKPIGSGPFQFVEWQRGNFLRLKRYDGYWVKDQPYLDEIIYRIIPDSQSRALALQTGQVQMTQANDIEPFDIPRFRAMPNLEVELKGWEYASQLSWIEINHRVKPLDDVRVRQAISHALDRSFILNKLWFGIGKVATGPIVSTTRYYDPSVAKLQAYNLDKAKALLDAAGLKPDGNGVRFTIKHLALPYGEVWMRLAEYFRTSLRKIGIEVVLETTDAGAWAKRIGDWEYETSTNFVSQFGDPTLGVERTYVSTNIKKVTFTNTGGYANPKIDALFQTARDSGDSAVRAKAFTEIQQILCEEIPQIWLMEMQWPTVHEKKLHNVIRTAMGPNAGFGEVFFG
ncbi:MAG: ABC transporter substrate-binding protein [Rhodospirillales bacterium]|nr:ABC transporter substrate-binding protein [Rhodospirillales bacterium]